MVNHEMNNAAEVLGREIKATRDYFDRAGQRMAALKAVMQNAIVERIKFGTETDARFLADIVEPSQKTDRPNVWQDIYYPSLPRVQHYGLPRQS